MAKTKTYLANTANPNQATIDALYDMANQAGIKNAKDMSYSDLTTSIKTATGTSGNTYGSTIGNRTLEQYGYTVDKAGNITKKAADSGGVVPWTNTANPNSAVSTGVTKLPGNDYMFNAAGVTPEMMLYADMLQNNYLSNQNAVNTGFANYIASLQSGAANANAALGKAKDSALAGIKSTYDNSARDYYRLYRTQETELPEQLSSVGATGGASETAALRLMNNYSDNLYKNETARNKDTNALNTDYQNAVAENSTRLAQQLADAYLQQAQALQNIENTNFNNQMNLYSMYTQNLEKQKAEDKKKEVEAWNNNVADRMAAQLDKGDTIWTWTDADGKNHWTTYKAKGVANNGAQLSAVDENKKVEDWNTGVRENIYKQLDKGGSVWIWTDTDGREHWSTNRAKGIANGGTELSAVDEVKAAETWNANARKRMAEQLEKGDTIWTWITEDGRVHWTTSESKGIVNGGTKLSKKKVADAESGRSGGSDSDKETGDEPLAMKYDNGNPVAGTPDLRAAEAATLPTNPAANTPYAPAYGDITRGFYSPNGTWISTSRNPLVRTFGTQGALQMYIDSVKK